MTRLTRRRKKRRAASPSTPRTLNTRNGQPSLRHVDCPGHADYVKNMITGAAQMDGAILVVVRLLTARCRKRASTSCCPSGWCSVHHRLPEQMRHGGRRRTCSNWSKGSSRTAQQNTTSRATTSHRQGAPPRSKVTRVRIWARPPSSTVWPKRSTPTSRRRSARIDGAFLMPVEDVFSISGRGTVVTGRVERGIIKSRRRNRNRWHQAHLEDHLHGRGNVPQAAGSRSSR